MPATNCARWTLAEQRASRSPAQHLDLLPPQAQQVSPASAVLASVADTFMRFHAIPSLVFQHSRNSCSCLHAIWREEDSGTGPPVMAHADTTLHPWSSPRIALFIAKLIENALELAKFQLWAFSLRLFHIAADHEDPDCRSNKFLHGTASSLHLVEVVHRHARV